MGFFCLFCVGNLLYGITTEKCKCDQKNLLKYLSKIFVNRGNTELCNIYRDLANDIL